MPTLFARIVREVFKREAIPTRFLWWFSAEGMCEWFERLRLGLTPHLGETGAKEVLAAIAAPLFRRRVAGLGIANASDRDVAFVLGALYRIASVPRSSWIFDALGGAPRTFADHRRGESLLAPFSIQARWEEVTCHLGELLIESIERLPASLPRARGILGEICFDSGVHFGKKLKHAFALDEAPEHALELLRMSEYVFRVNPDHWGESSREKNNGWLEGTACPWFESPGWNGAHCGIFGQFQSGIASVFGLRYHLTTTIPRHGGHTCRIDVRPIQLRRSREDAELAS